MTQILPYGSWPSPITAENLAQGGVRLSGAQIVEGAMWWTEGIAAEAGRQAVVRQDWPGPAPQGRDGAPEVLPAGSRTVVLPSPWSARSRVHEYGGASWAVLPGPLLVFVEFADQRVWALAPEQDGEPRPLTPEGPEVPSAGGPSLRWANPVPLRRADGTVDEVLWVCEDHTAVDAHGEPTIERYVAAVPLDGSAAQDRARIRRVTPASRFVAHPRISPDGSRIAWIRWEHPQMPWDGTELQVAELVDGVARSPLTVAGSATESVLQPEWTGAHELAFISDRSGWWNVVLADLDEGTQRDAHPVPEEFAGPMWSLGQTWYAVLPGRRLLTVHGTAVDRLGVLELDTGRLTDLDLPFTMYSGLAVQTDPGTGGVQVATVAASPWAAPGVVVMELPDEGIAQPVRVRTVRTSRDSVPDPAVLSEPEPITVAGKDGREVHAILWRPHLEGFAGPQGQRPPWIAYVHGGPTASTPGVLSMDAAYYTSRGIGYVAVNYGGSTGYGRAYRERLKGQWGVVDVEDTVAVMDHLVAQGLADGDRLGIEGGSAGGWTTLACLTTTDRFSAGVSSYGVAELSQFVQDTHDFESRYIDGLVGPWPAARELYAARAPLNHVDELSCPVLLLQGDEDRIVPPSQSELFAQALRRKDIPHAYLLFTGEQHGFRRAETIVAAHEAALSFYGQVFGFATDVPTLELVR